MKKLLLSISLTLMTAVLYGQMYWTMDFDTPWYLNRIVRDTVSNPNCSWQVGQPNKAVFTAAYSAPNAMMTDTLNPVPANDTSVFYLKHVRDQSQPFHIFTMRFWYRMDGDSTDYGTIEISPDTGNTWINLLTQDTTYQLGWPFSKPSLAGSTNGWSFFFVDMNQWASYPTLGGGPFPILLTADTILFRFTYITDSNAAPHDGWMLDDFYLEDWFEGIPEIQNDKLISIFPNPTSAELNILATNISNNRKVQILNYTGQVLYNNLNFTGEPIDAKSLENGMYLLKYSDTKSFCVKRFVVQH